MIVGPKVEEEGGIGVRYHAKERLKLGGGSEWHFEERESPLAPTSMLLVRVMVGKVADGNQLVESLRSTPIRQAGSDAYCGSSAVCSSHCCPSKCASTSTAGACACLQVKPLSISCCPEGFSGGLGCSSPYFVLTHIIELPCLCSRFRGCDMHNIHSI